MKKWQRFCNRVNHCAQTGFAATLRFGSGTQVIVTPMYPQILFGVGSYLVPVTGKRMEGADEEAECPAGLEVFVGPHITVYSNNDKLIFGAGTRLQVFPNIKNPDPAVYQLRSPKSSNTSVCLFTDFDSQTNVSQATGSTVSHSDSTVLDMKHINSKSYGTLLWSDGTDFGCEGTFNETFYSSSEFSCDATSVEKSFETDMNLNFQNLSVIGFRIVLLKVAGFNLLMTLRLWSS